jgi:hypothetical protein
MTFDQYLDSWSGQDRKKGEAAVTADFPHDAGNAGENAAALSTTMRGRVGCPLGCLAGLLEDALPGPAALLHIVLMPDDGYRSSPEDEPPAGR